MAKNRVQWTEQEDMMATSYENIADSFAYISKFMQSHVKTVKNGGGIVTNEDLEEALAMLKDMINKNLYNVSQMRVDISTGTIKPKQTTSSAPKSPSPWTSTSTNGENYQYESKSNKYMKRTINEAQLKQIVAESVKRVLGEMDWKTFRNAQEKNFERESEFEDKADAFHLAADRAKDDGNYELANELRRKANIWGKKVTRTNSFGSAAEGEFYDEYLKNIPTTRARAYFRTDDGSYLTPEPDYMGRRYIPGHGKVDGKYFDDNLEFYKYSGNDYQENWGGSELNGEDSDAYSDDALRRMGFDDRGINDIEKARREIRRYRNGNYTYDNGWKLKK